ncbi:MAG: hypothetical protein V4436_03050, partial [Patescibacteria group bacterium]
IAPNAIRFGLYSIKNFGSGVADSIIAERKENGPFTSLSNFLSRLPAGRQASNEGPGGILNKKGLESLIECGALDSLGELGAEDGGRGKMLNSIELLLEYHRESTREQAHDSLFSDLGAVATDLNLPPAAEASMADRLAWE